MTVIERPLVEIIPFDRLSQWMDEQGLPGGTIEDPRPIGGGTQNILVHFRRGSASYVLRRPPRHPRPTSNDTNRREARVLAALEGTAVPHPPLVAACGDDSVIGTAFFLMEPVHGFNPTTDLPALHRREPALRHEMGLRAVDAIAALSAVDPQASGLDGFGRPDGFLDRQVRRWLDELDSYRRFEGYRGPDLPGLDEVAAWLADNRPARWSLGLMHGDFHLANLMYSFGGAEVVAVVDWEMTTVGDPLLDLGWLLATWPDDNGRAAGMPTAIGAAGGLPSPAELVARYELRTGRDTRAIDWYCVLASFKLGILLEGSHARASAGKASEATGDRLHAIAIELFERARRRATA